MGRLAPLFNLECRVVVQETELGDWAVIFGEIVETHTDTDKLDPVTGKIDVSKIDPLVYCATIREYWNLGTRLGCGFSAGKDLVRKSKEKGGQTAPFPVGQREDPRGEASPVRKVPPYADQPR